MRRSVIQNRYQGVIGGGLLLIIVAAAGCTKAPIFNSKKLDLYAAKDEDDASQSAAQNRGKSSFTGSVRGAENGGFYDSASSVGGSHVFDGFNALGAAGVGAQGGKDNSSNNSNAAGSGGGNWSEMTSWGGGGSWSESGGFGGRGGSDFNGDTPLVLDGDHDARISTVFEQQGQKILFDINGDGRAEAIDWIGPNELILALDLNLDGIIDSGRELFGNAMPLPAGAAKAPNGFVALASYDDNDDGKIDKADGIFDRLMLWQDRNSNGHSEPHELMFLTDSKVSAISVFYQNVHDDKGLIHSRDSRIFQRSSYWLRDSNQGLLIVDVYFRWGQGRYLSTSHGIKE
jgi:hypothetical protein